MGLPGLDRPGRKVSVHWADGQVGPLKAIFSKLAAYDYSGWAVLEWECALNIEDGGRWKACFIRNHIIRVPKGL